MENLIDMTTTKIQEHRPNGLKTASIAAFQTHLRKFEEDIKRCALLQMDAISVLNEEVIDLDKLKDIGAKINATVTSLQTHWKKLQQINTDTPKVLRMYGSFFIEVMNQKKEGRSLLAQAISSAHKYVADDKVTDIFDMIGSEDFFSQPVPTVLVKGEGDKFLTILEMNWAAHVLFKYNKGELVGRKINVLMPYNSYGKFHDEIVQNFINGSGCSTANTKNSNLVFGRTKSNYIIPMYYTVRTISSTEKGLRFIATFRENKNLENSAYILTQPDGLIDLISSTCISMLKFDFQKIMTGQCNISEFVPGIIENRDQIFSNKHIPGKAVGNVEFKYPKDSEYWVEDGSAVVSTTFKCTISDITLLSGKQLSGIIFKFDYLPKVDAIDIDKRVADLYKTAKISNFQWNLTEVKSKTFSGKYVATSIIDSQFPEAKESSTRLLSHNINDDNSRVLVKADKRSKGSVKSKSIRKDPSFTRSFNWMTIILVLLMFAIAAIEYFIPAERFENIKVGFDHVKLENQRIAELQNVVSKIRDLQFLNMGIFTDPELEERSKAEIKASSSAVREIMGALEKQQTTLAEEHTNLLESNSIKLQYRTESNKIASDLHNINGATLEVISKALEVSDSELSEITSGNPDVYFVTYNNLNDYYLGLRRSSDLYATQLIQESDSTQIASAILFITSLIIPIVTMIAYFLMLPKFYAANTENLILLLDRSEVTLKLLNGKCARFVAGLEMKEDYEAFLDSDSSTSEEDVDGAVNIDTNRPRKKLKSTNKVEKWFIIKFLIAVCLMEVYFIANYLLDKSLAGKADSMVSEANSISITESFYSFAHNAERQLFIDNQISVLGRDSLEVVTENNQKMADLAITIQRVYYYWKLDDLIV